MELIALVKEGFQSIAEHAVSYKMGQTVLRQVDKVLWVVEKCARWAVPPPLDPEDRPQPELVRPLPWVFFLTMLVALRITRESISLVNLVLGKPPLRSADVVTYIQGKRRYLRTLKYQGNRMMRARTGSSHEPWYSGLRSLFDFTMCFRRPSIHYGNNNTTRVSNNDEVLVVKRSKRVRQDETPVASTSDASMERLIEKMMVDLNADSNDDSSYTLTNATSLKSDRSEDTSESDQESVHNDTPSTPQSEKHNDTPSTPQLEKHNDTPSTPQSEKQKDLATPSKPSQNSNNAPLKSEENIATPKPEESIATPKPEKTNAPPKPEKTNAPPKPEESKATPKLDDIDSQTPNDSVPSSLETPKTYEEKALGNVEQKKSPKIDSQALIQSEMQPYQKSPKKEKMANGRTVKSTSERDIGERRETNLPVARAASADLSSRGRKENTRKNP